MGKGRALVACTWPLAVLGALPVVAVRALAEAAPARGSTVAPRHLQ